MVYKLGLPNHELLDLVKLWSKKLDQNPRSEVEAFFVLEHLWETNPVHKANESIVVERLLAHFNYLDN